MNPLVSSGSDGSPQAATPRPLFTMRLGLRGHQENLAREAFGSRHSHQDDDRGYSHCESDQRLRCACPGTPGRPRCCHRATAEDRLCEACRDWCLAIGHDNKQMVRFIDCFGAAS